MCRPLGLAHQKLQEPLFLGPILHKILINLSKFNHQHDKNVTDKVIEAFFKKVFMTLLEYF